MHTFQQKSKLLLAVITTATLALSPACGGGSDGGTIAPPAATVSSISLTVAGAAPIASFTDTRTVTAVVRDANGGTIASPSLTWTSSAPAVATVSGSGTIATITSVGNGTATITAASGSVQGATSVTVAQVATTMAISGIPGTLAPGSTAQLTAVPRDAKGQSVAGTTGLTFTSANLAVAVVTANGALTAITPGVTQISASALVAGAGLDGIASVTVAFPVTANGAATASVAATTNNEFTPNSVSIRTGGTVTWSFASVLHNVSFTSGAGVPANIPNTASSDVTRTFNTAGTFTYDCTLHSGMRGTVIVAPATNASINTILNGANERPNAVVTAGAGAAMFTVNGTTVNYIVTFSRLSGLPIMAHIHGPGNATQAVGVLVDFPTTGQTLTNGVLTGTFNAASIRNAAISLDSLLVLMRNGNAYVNVHTSQNPAGEIRGQLGAP
ncbi:MAG: CHRD domain-containing protein [Gemmatimonadaceae bacterium]